MTHPYTDLNGDGVNDIIWQDAYSGDLTIWLMSGGSVSATQTYTGIPSTYTVVSDGGDYNSDGDSDLFWQGLSDGNDVMWQMDGTGVTATQSYAGIPNSYAVVAGDADYFGQGQTDLLWRGTTDGQLTMWQMNGQNVVSSTSYGNLPINYAVVNGASDFTGDGRSDILFRDMGAGEVTLWQMFGSQVVAQTSLGDVPTYISIVDSHTDLNGDGTTDILWRDNDSGNVVEWLMHNGQPTTAILGQAPLNFQIVDADGDYNHDGIDDVLFVNTSNNQVVMWTMNEQGQVASIDVVGTLPSGYVIQDATSDFTGDGMSDILLRSTTTGDVELWTMYGPHILSTTDLGSAGQNGRILDATGDGVTIVATQSIDYYATDGNDTLICNSQSGYSPTLVGGLGEDRFYIESGVPTIVNFVHNQDQLELNASSYVISSSGSKYPPGVGTATFSSGSTDPDSLQMPDSIVPRGTFYYSTSTGNLYFGEPAGSVAEFVVPVAHFSGAPTLTGTDILMV